MSTLLKEILSLEKSLNDEDLQVLNFSVYKDGGSTEVTTNQGLFFYDYSIGSDTKGSWFLGKPIAPDNNNLIKNQDEITKKIIVALKKYKNEFYNNSIKSFISKLQSKLV